MNRLGTFSKNRVPWGGLGVVLLLAALVFVAGACANTQNPLNAAASEATPAALPTYAPPATEQSAASAGVPAEGTASTGDAAGDTTGDSAGNSAGDAAASPPSRGAGSSSGYAAEIVADQQVAVAAQVGGQVLEITVDVGDQVAAGDVLVRLDSAALDAQRAQALASLQAAKAQLDLLQDPAKTQDVAAAQAALDAAAASYNRAANGPTAEEQRLGEAQLRSAEAAVSVAQAAYNQVKGNANIGMMPQSLQLQQATLAYEGAQAQYDKLMKGATPDLVAAASAQVANARAALQRLVDGAKPAQVEAAEAQMHAAENALYLATLQVDKATILAPMDGVVSKLQASAGVVAAPGTPLLTLLSNNVRVTVQVEESLLPRLAPGQPATISAEAYPDRVFRGTIAYIAPELDAATRTVQVTVRPDSNDGLLHPGMSATVQLDSVEE